MNISSDEAFVQAFLQGTLPPTQFHHRDHLRLTWYVVRHHDLATTTQMITTGIRRFATHHGQAQKYHETMTQFWIRIVAHMVRHRPDLTDFEAFLAAFPQLLAKDLPFRHWQRETMMSDIARAQWVEPDVLTLPAAE
jgi:hypothetical protein